MAFLQNNGQVQNTSFDSMDTNEIFMTYAEGEGSVHGGDYGVDVDREVEIIKQKMDVQSQETEGDENQGEGR